MSEGKMKTRFYFYRAIDYIFASQRKDIMDAIPGSENSTLTIELQIDVCYFLIIIMPSAFCRAAARRSNFYYPAYSNTLSLFAIIFNE
jgi:hypothetical protein